MLWEELTSVEFKESIEKTKGVALVPIGCLEKHGYHLPLGTDIFIARNLAIKASEIEPALVVPSHPYGIISEAQHRIGTLSVSSQLQYQILEELCDELARNGYKKIIIINGHGGASIFLKYFAQSRLEKPHPYIVYVIDAHYKTVAQEEEFIRLHGPKNGGGHADMMETSEIMVTHPHTVHMDRVDVEETKDKRRISFLAENGLYTGIWWYGSYPHHVAGDPSNAAPHKGEYLEKMYVENLVKAIKLVKEDNKALELQEEFYSKIYNPEV